jgi:hypothetical protein
MGRSTQGVIVMRLRDGEQVSSLAPVVESESDSEPDSEPAPEPLSELEAELDAAPADDE